MSIELVMGGFYTCHQEGHDPVHIWIGRVDLPSDLGRDAKQPVASLVLTTGLPDTPIMSHAPFWESAAFDGEMTVAAPFEVDRDTFEMQHAVWLMAWENGEASAWSLTPNEAYAAMISDMRAGLQR